MKTFNTIKSLCFGALTVLGISGYAQNTFPGSGNAGIGTGLSPSYNLHIKSADIRAFQIDGSNASWSGMYINSTNATGQPFYGYISNNGLNYGYSYLTPAGDWRLYVSGDRFSVLKNGNVGIGALVPANRLTVNGAGAYTVDIKTNGRIQTGDASNVGGVWLNGAGTQFVGQYDANKLGFYNGGNWRLVVDQNGNVGIGTATPAAPLSVNGLICAKEVRVALSGAPCWPDYVFTKEHNLKSLEEVEVFIKQNQHLPEIPSAKEVEANGVELGTMNIKLLEKIEELTLYMIEMKKENSKLKQRVEVLEKK